MSLEERTQFERHRYYKEILQIRINDEKAKQIGLSVPDINHYRTSALSTFNFRVN
jgi:2-amino-1-hydroxyethylphosphonate dioxygenase (glycine-forming)